MTLFGEGSNVAKNTDFGGIYRFKPRFCQPVPTNPTKRAEKVYLGILQHHPNIQAKILTAKFYL